MKFPTLTLSILLIASILTGCAAETSGEQYFRRSDDGENRIPFGGRSECLPFENYTPPDDCPDE